MVIKNKKGGLTENKIVKVILVLIVIVVIMFIFFPKIWRGTNNIFSFLGLSSELCIETGLSVKEYNFELDTKLYLEDLEGAETILLEYFECFNNFENIEIRKAEDAQILAEMLCENNNYNESFKLYEYIPDAVESTDPASISKKESCYNLYDPDILNT